jgi:ABC-type sugar transport system permease subunit
MRLTERIKIKLSKKRARDLIFYSLVLAFPLAQFCVFYIGVNFNSILLAFKRYGADGRYTWAGLENFRALFANFRDLTAFRVGFANSLVVFAVGTAACMTLGLMFAYYIYKKAPLRNFFKVLLFAPGIIPSIALIVMFKQIADNGVPAFFGLFGLKTGGLLSNPKTTMGAIIFYNVWFGFGVSVLLYIGAMERIPPSVTEAARLDGAGYFREFRYVALPLTFDTITTFLTVALGGIFVNQANIYAFYSNGAEERVFTIGYWLYRETVKTGAYAEYPMLSAFGLLLSAATIPLVYTARLLSTRFGPTAEQREARNAN